MMSANTSKGAEKAFIPKDRVKIYKLLLDTFEKPLIENVLRKTEGNQLEAAKVLGINRNTLHAKIKKLEIDVNGFKKQI